jgi:hypothetical protein
MEYSIFHDDDLPYAQKNMMMIDPQDKKKTIRQMDGPPVIPHLLLSNPEFKLGCPVAPRRLITH